MNYFLITFDRQPNNSYTEVHDYLVKHEQIYRWFHYIKSSYIIGTTMTAKELGDHFGTACDNANVKKSYLVIAVDLKDRSGWLVPDAWAWIKKNAANK